MIKSQETINPFVPKIEALLFDAPYWRINALAERLFNEVAPHTFDADPDKALFKKNFILMNGLFTLQTSLLESGWQLSIDGIEVRLVKGSADALLTCPSPLAEYYLDWQHYDTSKAEVRALLDDFWLKYTKTSPVTESELAHSLNFFELSKGATLSDAKKAWQKFAHIHHPDKGGNRPTFQRAQAHWQSLKRHLKSST